MSLDTPVFLSPTAHELLRQTGKVDMSAYAITQMIPAPARRWIFDPATPIPAWVASRAHDRGPSPSLFVRTVDGVTEVKPGEWIARARCGVRAQVVRATDAA